MLVGVGFAGQAARFEIAPERLLGHWTGPEAGPGGSVRERVRAALEHPCAFPPMRQAVIPGDRVVIPFDPAIPDPSEILAALCEVLIGAGVEAHDITILSTDRLPEGHMELPQGVVLACHDPADRTRIAYLASTANGRRIYLDRLVTDADVVVPVGLLGFGPGASYRGPWAGVFPGLSDQQTRRELEAADRSAPRSGKTGEPASFREAAEVSWLLGSQFHVGVVAGASGAVAVIAGQQDEVRRLGVEAVEAAWSIRGEPTAELVLAGIGVPWRPTTLEDLAAGLETAAGLARVGGKLVALADLGPIEPGPALRRLAEVEDPRLGPLALRGLEREADYSVARRLAAALARADIYLYSRLDPDLVEGLGMIPLDQPQDARRLVQLSDSCIVISPADWMRIEPDRPVP